MPPVPLTVATPSLTSHLAGPPSLSFFHWDKSSPSNSRIASEGGGPGLMIFGSSLGGGISPSSAAKPPAGLSRAAARIVSEARIRQGLVLIISWSGRLTEG